MPAIHIIMPQLGESIAEARVVQFLVQPGDHVEADQDLIEVETDKATMTVASPCKGRLENFSAQLDESYAVGATLGRIEATPEEAARLGLDAAAPQKRLRDRNCWPKPKPTATNPACNRPCAACRCRPTPPAPAIFHPGSRRAWTNWACTPPTWRAWPAAARRAG